MIKFWSYSSEYKKLKKKILKSINSSIESGKIFFGPELDKFEKKFIKIYKFKYRIFFFSIFIL